jgi:hypothetical protein
MLRPKRKTEPMAVDGLKEPRPKFDKAAWQRAYMKEYRRGLRRRSKEKKE